jgi:hypothetical protein
MMTRETCPSENELFWGYKLSSIQTHINCCEDCASLAALVHRVVEDKDSIFQMTEEEVGRVRRFVVGLIRDVGARRRGGLARL